MKKVRENQKKTFDNILPDYGRRMLLTYADSIRELADTFTERGYKDHAEKKETEETDPAIDRKDYIWQKRMLENEGLMAGHLQEMAQIMAGVAKEARNIEPMGERRFRQISHALRELGVQLKNLYLIGSESGRLEVAACMKNVGKNTISSDEMGDLFSVLLNTRLESAKDNAFFITDEYKTFYYSEEAGYQVLYGTATAIKENEKISGDSYAFFETGIGNQTVALSDGMGSGEKANRDSSMVVELMQKFLEAGFQAETAIMMINSSLIAGGEATNLSTLDLCSIDLYSAACRFVKVGSASSYIKRGHLVERISAGNLPMGIFQKPDVEVVSRNLMDGDYIIMLSDGIGDALSRGVGEEILSELIGSCMLENPGEIAGRILSYCIQQSKGHIRDDMTVLVIGIWQKEGE